jgi:sigma-E factor negative regulatory protein RseC
MIEAQARVTRAEGETAYVEARNTSSCSACSSDSGCGAKTLVEIFGGPAREFRALNQVGAKPGDNVVVGLEDGALLKGSLTVYLVPLALLFLGAIAASHLAPAVTLRDVYSICGGAVGLLLGFVGVKLYAQRITVSGRFQPVILRMSNEIVCTVIKET